MLQVCDIGHKAVCYEITSCPVCLIKRELEMTVTRLRNENKELMDENKELMSGIHLSLKTDQKSV